MEWWQTAVLAVLAVLLPFGGVLLGHVLTRRGAVELDQWRRREEAMRMLRWAAELAVSDDERTADLGIATLEALRFIELLQPADDDLVDAVTEVVTGATLDRLDADSRPAYLED
jgi:hypothetical protein